MSRSWDLFLQDMEEATLKILRRTRGLTFETFKGDDLLYDAVVRNLETLGEAAKGIPTEIRDQLPDVDWRGVAGLRDVLSHAYFAIDDTTLWDIIQKKVPEVADQLKRFRVKKV